MNRTYLCVVLCVVCLVSCVGAAPLDHAVSERADHALDAAAAFLHAAQDDDGAWRSGTYGLYRDGPSLTAHVLTALVRVAPDDERTHRGLAYLSDLVNDDGEIASPLIMPVYTAANAAQAFIAAGRSEHARPWLELLLSHQMTEQHGWSHNDLQYGGWGYSTHVPDRPDNEAQAATVDANISATVFALTALRLAQHAPVMEIDPAVFSKASGSFLLRCQNVAVCGSAIEQHDDGGFFFTPMDPARNKGGAEIDASGRTRFHAYGSATADGYRALILAGAGSTSECTLRLSLAERWLDDHFDPASMPGAFEPDREVLRDAYFHYYTWSISEALRQPGVRATWSNARSKRMASLRDELLSRQRGDGSWSNPFTDGREDDPLIATTFAAIALSNVSTAPNSSR